MRELPSRRYRIRRPGLLCSVLTFAFALSMMSLSMGISARQQVDGTQPAVASTGHVAKVAAPEPATPSAQRIGKQRIVLRRNDGTVGTEPVPVSVGIPFPPGMLRDARLVRILDDKGAEVPASIKTTLRWFAKDGSIRAVRAQFRATLTGEPRTFYFSIGQPRHLDLAGWSYGEGLVGAEHGMRQPQALATLEPAWLCDSLIAGPQVPAAAGELQANFVSEQFTWARRLPVDDSTAWLFDRPSTLFKAYVRTGRFDYLQAAEQSYRFYMTYIRRDGLPMSPFCAGGWTYNKKPCDVKYVYVEPILLALGLTGDDSESDTETVDKMMTLWESGGWNNPPGPYSDPMQEFTERFAGLGLLETVSAYELTGDSRYLARIKDRIGWLYEHQRNNPDHLGDDGSWRNSWLKHEGGDWDPAKEVRGSSPWMSENIIDGLWHAWLVTGDSRIPDMITDFGHYMEQYGWIRSDQMLNPHGWRNPCSGPEGQIAWYWSSAHASKAAMDRIQESEGWYSDAHTVELALPVAAARYFERDPRQSAALERRLALITHSLTKACASEADTLRRFNWNNRGSGVVAWLIRQPAGSGRQSPPKTVSSTP
ncbi:hypothetical protein ACVWWQ_000359 [Rhodanobacter sp. TND4EL1]